MMAKRHGAALLVGTILSGLALPAAALAQDTAQPTAAPATAEPVREGMIRSIQVTGAERIERETVIAYSTLQPGQTYTAATLDQALRALYDTELFSDVVISGADTGNLVIAIEENPIINRIVLEGNKRLKDDKIAPEIRLAPRRIYTRSKVRADVDRIIELYKREGRFAAVVEPKIVELDQNRVDLIFEISEGPKSKIRSINIIGNETFSDAKLIKQMYSRETGGLLGFLKSNTSYDPDRLGADQQLLRLFYLTEGYADFRVVSALAELTPDREDFVITYVIEEGPRYKFGTVETDSALRDFDEERMNELVDIEPGDWFNAKKVEDTVTALNEAAGFEGYAFADVSPAISRNPDDLTMDITFRTNEARRVYIDRVDINGNTVTRDNVIRREFRLFEGDAFNATLLRRTEDRIRSLGFFNQELEIKQTPIGDDRVALTLDVEERPTGQLTFSAGFSSLERFLLSAQISQNNFMGKGQTLLAGVNWSRYSRSVQFGFTEPFFLGRPILLGADVYRRDFNSFNFVGSDRRSTYSQLSTGGGLRLGFPVTEYLSAGVRYNLVLDDITLDRETFYSDFDDNGVLDDDECDPVKAGTYLCGELGERLTSSIGYSLAFNNTDGLRATRGIRASLRQDFAGLGGDVRYLRTIGDATRYFKMPADFVLSVNAQGGYVLPLDDEELAFRDPIRISDRFFGPNFRGFDIRGIGPRVLRRNYDADGNLSDEATRTSNALGGKAYYFGRLELEFPTSAALRNFGVRPSAFVDIGSVWDLTAPDTSDILFFCSPAEADGPDFLQVEAGDTLPGGAPITACSDVAAGYVQTPGYREDFVGNSPNPRVTVGIGANWVSPFGPLRLDLATALVKQEGDDTRLFSFNVGTQF
ncbi:outer membrane protein assembly factor BamA [Sphingomicrobium aestuariivivum]|uniref:outer membrane protein assembly factor BamA n=1 Tax=Sphingomicrobium aestuariivivum TaxID=1582356 RepID=UPI001FD67DE7|nr:outer membrane protein assembly factor BamA [Sphingomicrobium aestuariivivum]MCJ8189809.1 outer membrane protein assembly factor BamA [Sphingomicrobium aestuariivivum]